MSFSTVLKPPFTHTPTTEDYKTLSKALFSAFSKQDFDFVASVTHPSGENFNWTHDDGPAVTDPKQFIEHFKYLVTNIAPEYNYENKDIVVELLKDGEGQPTGAKVWVFGIITGLPGGKNRETVDMLDIDEKGYWLGGKDVQRDTGSAQ